ncbi:protein-L-isoaspartate O-methyltransferase family protein [Tropicimonas isoalkanivorans]|uniref:Protein-L-isoaspartate O-methyltransferase n=1 Tax=Tropicimonas isoalkanivorans TaxID=441112 RepID=A0A1I1FX26_9RHOB|nr:protein-L-isoaspartate O-methyltransferase [Tropicimonas isoalkanivorans]SFC03884.1 protein-L-isoaspartate(D-aspartate) O-methyltransferase [Tropicimonas isoalkanivorans]
MSSFTSLRTTMVDTQIRPSDVTKYSIISALLAVPRELYVPANLREVAYAGQNVPIGDRRVMLEPRTLAKMLDALNIGPTDLVLDVAAGLGYATAVAARLAEAVVALEEDQDLASEAESTLAAEGVDNAAVIQGPLTEGAPQHGPYDVIMIQGGVATLPQAFMDQLKEGGRIACLFMDSECGAVRIGYKIDGAVNWRFAFNAGAPVMPGFEAEKAFSL